MQSLSSISSGLLTLSVHEALTFDGVEIALHPEIFSGASGGMQGKHSRDTSYTSSAVSGMQGRHNRDFSFSSAVGISGRNNVHGRDLTHASNNARISPTSPIIPTTTSVGSSQDEEPSLQSTPRHGQRSPAPGLIPNGETLYGELVNQSPTNENLHTILPGDLIEIRVWDLKSNRPAPPNNILKPNIEYGAIPSDGINNANQTSLSYDGGIIDSSSIARENQQTGQQPPFHPLLEPRRPQSERLSPFVSTKPPIAPRNTSISSSITNSPKHVTSHLAPSTVVLPTSFTPSQSEEVLNSERNRDDLSTKKNPSEVELSLSLDGSETHQSDRTEVKGIIKPEAVPNSRLSSLDSSSSNVFASAVQSTDDYRASSMQRNPDVLDIISYTHDLRFKIVMAVTEKSLSALKSTSRVQVSVLRQVAELYDLSSYETKVTVTKVEESDKDAVLDSVQVDFATVTIKDQFVSRGEMYQFSDFFAGSWIYVNQRLTTDDGLRGNVMEMRHGKNEAKSGFVTSDTKITFRSRSTRIIWLVQISSEMWDYAPPYACTNFMMNEKYSDKACDIYFDKFVSFMYRLYDKWKELEVTHSLTIIFFSRTYISSKRKTEEDYKIDSRMSAVQKETDGRLYEDHFKVVVENERRQASEWKSLVPIIKKAFVSYPSEVGWDLSSGWNRLPSTATQGNILEAINTTLNLLRLHYMDRDLCRSGNSLVIVSAGSGVFEVDKDLAGITKQRMIDHGIGCDMLSLGLPPLHVAPFFLYKEVDKSSPNNMHAGFDEWKTYFEIPHWMHLSFISYDGRTKANIEKRVDAKNNLSPQLHILSNSFLIRNDPAKTLQAQQPSNTEYNQQRHLISGRDFEDILEACRPRNCGDSSMMGLPSALLCRLELSKNYDSQKIHESTPKNSIYTENLEEEKLKIREWGSVVFDEVNKPITTISECGFHGSPIQLSSDQVASSSNSGNQSLHGGSPTSNHLIASPSSNGLQIQVTKDIYTSLYVFENNLMPLKAGESSDSLSTMGTCDIGPPLTKKMVSIESLSNSMINYDDNVFTPVPEKLGDLHVNKIKTSAVCSKDNQPVPRMLGEESNPIISSMHGTSDQIGEGGIGEALIKFNKSRQTVFKEPGQAMKVHRSIHSSSSLRFSNFSPSHSLEFAEIIGRSPRNTHLLPSHITHIDTSQQKIGPVPLIANNFQSSEIVSRLNKQHTSGRMNSRPNSLIKVVQSPEKNTKTKYKKKTQRFRKTTTSSQKPKSKVLVFNPFRQEDEEEVLARRTYDSRRWSHVFPKGEIEFKRHAGPNWKSLCQPAILPATIDIHNDPKELKDYTFNHYTVSLDADLANYESHSDLLKEMVKQRLIQDFQLVPESILLKNKMREVDRNDAFRPNRSLKKPLTKHSHTIQHTLSMGHRIQVLSYESDAVKVVEYHSQFAQNVYGSIYRYNYMLLSSSIISSMYARMSQSFERYAWNYPWNKVDNYLISVDASLAESMKYRRLSFRIIPDNFDNEAGEQEYIKKIQRLLDYLEKQVLKIKSGKSKFKVISSANRQSEVSVDKGARRKFFNNLKSFTIPLRKGKRGKHEWMEMVIDESVDTKKTFRIMFHWLVASAVKVENQIQVLSRRCSQYGLRLVKFPHFAQSSNMLLNPFHRPEIIPVQDVKLSNIVESALLETFEFVDDGKYLVNQKNVEEAIGSSDKGGTWAKAAPSQQYAHKSGTILIRLLQDKSCCTWFVFLENRMHTGSDSEVASEVFQLVTRFITNLKRQSF